MSCSSGKCNCGSSCSCGSSCNCNSADIERSTTTTMIVDGVAPQMTYENVRNKMEPFSICLNWLNQI
ncbi:Metallothionein, family 15, plant [Cynara cardunculus var. scolymus]|uniref:Metallothionein-like protein n=1 Tax=Cynara cardunculus var. scolymus TaxID=59895 RepID=A0A118K1Z6_CYNCS|nr:Metallothionein, family 15, plant [Cynara cardunculus var. scolymus]